MFACLCPLDLGDAPGITLYFDTFTLFFVNAKQCFAIAHVTSKFLDSSAKYLLVLRHGETILRQMYRRVSLVYVY